MNEKRKLKISILADKSSVSSTINSLIDSFINVLKDDLNTSYDYLFEVNYLLENNDIKFCKNCKKCFKENICPLDECDDMKKAKNILMHTDLFIVGCPVYENNVSAFIKAFLDRVGYWCHLMPMLGTKCVVIVTAKNTGYDFVSKYLYTVLTYMGFDIQDILCKNLTKFEDDLLQDIRKVSKQIKQDILDGNLKNSNPYLEKIYEKYKYIYLNFVKKDQDSFEYTYWEKLKEIDSYQHLIEITNSKLKD